MSDDEKGSTLFSMLGVWVGSCTAILGGVLGLPIVYLLLREPDAGGRFRGLYEFCAVCILCPATLGAAIAVACWSSQRRSGKKSSPT